MRELQSADVIRGSEGRAYAKINGNNEELFFAKKVEATIELTKTKVKSIGRRMTGHKVTGGEGTGSMTLYYLSPLFRAMLVDYLRTGRTPYFDLVIENDDPESAAKKQTVLLKGVCLDSYTLAKLDGDAEDGLEEEVEFTFEGADILTPFTKL